MVLLVKNTSANAGDVRHAASVSGWGRSSGGDMVKHSSILSERIPGTEETGGLQSIGSQRVRLK